MNTGLQDAYNLGWKLAMTLEGVASDSLLRTYNEERHPIGTKLLQTTDRAFSTVAGTGNLFKIVRAILFSPVGKKLVLPRLMELAPQWASQLGINYRSSSLAMSQLPLKLWGSWPLVGGDRLPYFSFYNQKVRGSFLYYYHCLCFSHFPFLTVSHHTNRRKNAVLLIL
jgi:hypothetical protein